MFRVLLTILLTATFAQPQEVEARFSLAKEAYALGEPIYLHYEVVNVGKVDVSVLAASPYSFCAGYEFALEDAQDRSSSSCGPWGFAGNCMSSTHRLAPGQKKMERILLNEILDFPKPGTYPLRATRRIPFATSSEQVFPLLSHAQALETETRLEVRVEEADAKTLETFFAPYLAAIKSQDELERLEAVRAISTLAPPFLEDLLIEWTTRQDTRFFAVKGLRKLNSRASRQALAQVIVDSRQKYLSESELAIRYLGEMGDRSYLPLLMEVAASVGPNTGTHQTAVAAIAELGREDSMPFLTRLLVSGDEFARANAIFALPRTGARAAVPLLIDLLQSPTEQFRHVAANGLIRLTHRSPDGKTPYVGSNSMDPSKWVRWWSANHKSVTIYDYHDCGDITSFD